MSETKEDKVDYLDVDDTVLDKIMYVCHLFHLKH